MTLTHIFANIYAMSIMAANIRTTKARTIAIVISRITVNSTISALKKIHIRTGRFHPHANPNRSVILHMLRDKLFTPIVAIRSSWHRQARVPTTSHACRQQRGHIVVLASIQSAHPVLYPQKSSLHGSTTNSPRPKDIYTIPSMISLSPM